MITIFNMQISTGLLALGLIEGMTYGILAVGLVLVYRSSRVINFAHGEIGAFGAAVCGVSVVKWHVPYWFGLALGVAVAAGTGALAELAVVRRLRHAPKLMSIVATLGVASFLLAFSSVVNSSVAAGASFPQPTGLPTFHVGVFLVTRAYMGMLVLSPIVVITLGVFLRRSRTGLAVRAASSNLERARMVGISASRMSTLTWAIAGGVAAVTAVLIIPTRGFVTAEILGPTLLLRALAPAAVAKMKSLPVAFGAAIGVGVVDQILIFNHPTSGVPNVLLFLVIVVALLFQSPRTGRADEREDWTQLQPWPALSQHAKQVRAVRLLPAAILAVAVTGAVAVGILASNQTAVTMTAIVAFSLIGLSLGILTGLGGQLSLGQFALAGVGASASYAVTYRTGNFPLALVAAAAATALVCVVLGLPALRIRGLLLGVATLAFALAAKSWLLPQPWVLGDGVNPGRPIFGSISLDVTKRYYLYSLLIFLIAYALAWNVWRGGIGLRLRAQRDNEDAARALGMSVTLARLQGFLIAGILAGLGGSVYGHLLSRISPDSFDVATSINIVAISVLGGIGVLWGPVLGALYIIGLPRFVPLDSAGLAATSLGWLVLILYFPGGIAQVFRTPRGWILRRLAGPAALDAPAAEPESGSTAPSGGSLPAVALRSTSREAATASTGQLEIRGVSKRYGGITAVDGVSLSIPAGEILGILGPNGAGKTTLFEIISGFTPPDGGTVWLDGRDITRSRPEARSNLGLVRSFQDPALFPTLTPLEAIIVALERVHPTRAAASIVGLQRPERRKLDRAAEIAGMMGLAPFMHKQIRELSTGTRRITELACIVAVGPRVLLLDEPSSGIAQRESEALGEVLMRLREHLQATFLVIEHDIPLLMTLADRMIAMDTGRLIADGSPAEVRRHPLVVESYLGGDITAIERSGGTASTPAVIGRACAGVTRAGGRCQRRAGPEGLCHQHRVSVTS